MPDLSGQLTTDDIAKIHQWWIGRWKDPVVCPVCKSQEWGMASHVVTLHRNANDAFIPTTQNYPHLLVGCKTCAHTMLFNAVQMGISLPYIEPVAPPSNAREAIARLLTMPPPPPPQAPTPAPTTPAMFVPPPPPTLGDILGQALNKKEK